ncbi:MAG: hypothetical protein JO015_08780 [Verrucomicrobia bacterium]|nr:hypothetical protein [Verrucomicrobiota bacterium]
MQDDQYRPQDQARRRRRRRTHGKANPVAAVLIALILIALVVTAVVCMLRKAALPAQGAARVGTESVIMLASMPYTKFTEEGRWLAHTAA